MRPLIDDEIITTPDDVPHVTLLDDNAMELCSTTLNTSNIRGNTQNPKYEFSFDKIFSPKDHQENVFEEISMLVQVKILKI